MTQEEYGAAYHSGYPMTTRFLLSRGLCFDLAEETAQAAWARGWECRAQLRNSQFVLTWINSIAWNIHRARVKRDVSLVHVELSQIASPAQINLAAIDVERMLKTCKDSDRLVLQRHYLEGDRSEEIARNEGWSATAVRTRMSRARRALGQLFAA